MGFMMWDGFEPSDHTATCGFSSSFLDALWEAGSCDEMKAFVCARGESMDQEETITTTPEVTSQNTADSPNSKSDKGNNYYDYLRDEDVFLCIMGFHVLGTISQTILLAVFVPLVVILSSVLAVLVIHICRTSGYIKLHIFPYFTCTCTCMCSFYTGSKYIFLGKEKAIRPLLHRLQTYRKAWLLLVPTTNHICNQRPKTPLRSVTRKQTHDFDLQVTMLVITSQSGPTMETISLF